MKIAHANAIVGTVSCRRSKILDSDLTGEYTIPSANQPNPDDFAFDVEHTLTSLLTVKAQIPANALTASVLGTEREGHGVLINDQGLVLTIGYVITEAETVGLVDHAGNYVPSHVVAYDQETGFGLVQGLRPMELPVLDLGNSDEIKKGESMILAGAGGVENSTLVSVVGIREFAGYWEYLLDRAFFTAPAHPSWGGAALIGEDGKLYGIGSLILQYAGSADSNSANMIIPINLLPPILDDLLRYGKRSNPPRPWLGWYVQETKRGLFVVGVVDNGPAQLAGIQVEDHITEINGVSTVSLSDLYRAVWASGQAGVDISVAYKRVGQRQQCLVESIDRSAMLARASIH